MIGRTNSTFGGSISLPDGSTATANDVQTWLKCAGINKSYTSVSQVVADTDTMFLLMSDENAMKYLARSTDFADTICADETSMTYLGQSAYVDSTILNSDLWVTKISSSSYWDLVYPVVTVHSSASATITVAGKSFTSDATGNTQHSMPWGTFSISDSVSGQSFERTITKETTDVYAMPESALYWYGNECIWITGGIDCDNYNYTQGEVIRSNNIYTKESNQIKTNIDVKNNSKSLYGISGTVNAIDVTNYSKLKTMYSDLSYTSGSMVYLLACMTKFKTFVESDYTLKQTQTYMDLYKNFGNSGIIESDISSITGNQYISWLYDWASAYTYETATVTRKAVWLE